MTIDKAIRILEGVHRSAEFEWGSSNVDALKLGIEALKRIQYLQENDPCCCDGLLPGETEE